MTLPRDTMLELMAYADGELDGEAHARVEALVASNEEARRVVLALDDLGEWVREGSGVALAAADGIAELVMARVEAVGAASVAPERAGSVSGSPASQLRAPLAVAAEPAPAPLAAPVALSEARGRLAGRDTRGRGRAFAAAAGVLALAAATMLFLRGAPGPGRDRVSTNAPRATGATGAQPVGEGPSIGPLPFEIAPSKPIDPSAAVAAGNEVRGPVDVDGVDVEQVESPSHQVSVFYLPAVAAATAGSNASSVVVWIGDDKALGGL